MSEKSFELLCQLIKKPSHLNGMADIINRSYESTIGTNKSSKGLKE
jgi:hypothetical protein